MSSGQVSLTKAVGDFTKKFKGFSAVRMADRAAAISSITNWIEVPALNDQLNWNASEPSIDDNYIFGSHVPWVSSATPGETTLSFTVAALDDTLINLGWTKKTVTDGLDELAATAKDGKAGSWAFVGADMSMKAVEQALWFISEDGKSCLVIKNFRGYAQLVFDGSSPVGIKFSGKLTTPLSGDSEGDVLIGTYTDSAAS